MNIDDEKLRELLAHRGEDDLLDGSHLDFKEKLPLNYKNERQELAKDLVGFANTRGGYLIIGVEDETWHLVGIEPQAFDYEKIEGVARTIRPMLTVTAKLVHLEGKNYGVIYVPKTHEVHSRSDGSYFVRIGRSTVPAEASVIANLLRENQIWRARQNRLASLEDYQDEDVDELLERYAEKLTAPGIRGHLSKTRREYAFFARKAYEEVFDSFRKACKVRIQPSERMNEDWMKILMVRAYGLLAAGYLTKEDGENSQHEPIIITIELDPTALYPENEEEPSPEEEVFFGWLTRFKGMSECKYDRNLFRMNQRFNEIQTEDFLQFLDNHFEWMHNGAARALEPAKLENEMLKKQIEAMDAYNPLMWVILANFALASIPELFSLKVPFKGSSLTL
jgi:hypothetical protein